ncbi:MAG: DegV family protein [Chloroflexia bacterium]|nr:DegV family protein [Chloroflexia bacterium]
MQIVSDRGMDLPPEIFNALNVHLVPLILTLDGKSYRSGVDIQPTEFYALLAGTDSLPSTSQPSPGFFTELYEKLGAEDREILSVHISSGLSGTVNAALVAAEMVPELDVTVVDTKTLSGAEGWQVEAAARAAQAGWSKERTLALIEQVGAATETLFTLSDLKYLIHGGRISHIKGLIASVLNIKPVIGVEKKGGTYVQRGQARTFSRSVKRLVDLIAEQHPAGTALRIQVLHAHNPEGAAMLHHLLDQRFECAWLPTGTIAPVLGAHTGPSLVGAVWAPLEQYPQLP